MTEWRLFESQVPELRPALAVRPWMNLEGQPGFAQRARLVTDLVCYAAPVSAICDLGCGDGALLARLKAEPELDGIPMWGYDLGAADVAHGRARGLDLRLADVTGAGLDYGSLAIASEVAEHLEDPEEFLRGIGSRFLVVSSPSAETASWHNEIHAWAWDLAGYRDLVERSGWRVTSHRACAGGMNTFGGVTGPQRFQAILAAR
jgi:methyltransferase family protein